MNLINSIYLNDINEMKIFNFSDFNYDNNFIYLYKSLVVEKLRIEKVHDLRVLLNYYQMKYSSINDI